jgi:hypothetical protein
MKARLQKLLSEVSTVQVLAGGAAFVFGVLLVGSLF